MLLQFYGPLDFHPDTTYEDLINTPPELSTSPVEEESELAVLANNGLPNNLEYKKLKHLFELFNTAYVVAMNPSRDVSGLVPCGWQMNYG